MTSVEKTTPIPLLSRPRKLLNQAKILVLMISRRWWFGFLVLFLAFWLVWEFRTDLREYGEFILDQERFSAYVRSLGLAGPLVLWISNAIQVLIAILPGHAIAFASGYIYGTYIGFIIMYTSTIVAGQIAFLLARRFGRPLVVHFVPEKYLSQWDRSSRRYGFTFYLVTLLLPVFPTDLLTFVAGLSMISVPKFTLANLLGRAPYLFLMSMIGALGIEYVVQGLSPTAWLFLAFAMVVVIWAYRYLLPKISRIIFDEE
jgi:uncharacterized membrane protein YdjX (TVP38/TMEM64 family)